MDKRAPVSLIDCCRSSAVTLDPTSMMLDSIGGKRESREDCEVWNSQLLSPKFWLLPSARFKPVLKGFKPIYTIQGTLFLSHGERQGLSSEAPGPAEAPAKGAWRRGLGVSASRRQECSPRGRVERQPGRLCSPIRSWVPGADHRLVSIIDRHAGLKNTKRLNEPNSKNANHLVNID